MDEKFEKLMKDISDGKQDIDLKDFVERAEMGDDWDWEEVYLKFDADEVLKMIRAGLS